MSRSTAARAVTAFTLGDADEAAALVGELTHADAIASLLEVASVITRVASWQTGIPAEQLLNVVGEHR